MEKEKHLGLRIDAETHKKLKSLAEFEGRSINGEVLYLIRQAIIEFENKQWRTEIKESLYMDIRKARSVVWNGQILFGQEIALYFQWHIVVLTALDQTV